MSTEPDAPEWPPPTGRAAPGGLGDAMGRIIHGEQWDAVRAAQQVHAEALATAELNRTRARAGMASMLALVVFVAVVCATVLMVVGTVALVGRWT